MRTKEAAAGQVPARSALLTNAGALVAGRLGVAALGWAGTILIVRNLSVDEFGRFSFIFGFLGLLSIVTDLGIGRVAIAGVVDHDQDRGGFAGTYVLLRVALGFLGYAVAVGFVVLAGYPDEVVRTMAVAAVIVVIATPSHAYNLVFQAHGNLSPVAVASLLGQVTQLALTAAVAVAGGSLLLFVLPAVAFELVSLSWSLRSVRRLLRIRYRVVWRTWLGLVREAVPLAIGGALATAYYRLDSVMLSKLDTFTSVGLYGVAYKFVDVLHFVPAALSLALLPVLVGAWPDRPGEFRDGFGRAFTVLVLVATFVVAEFSVFARPLITALYGSAYAPAAGAARLVVVGECIAFFSGLAFTTLVAVGRHRLYPLAAGAGLVVNVGLNLWLIPSWSYRGAAMATLATEVLVATVLWVSLLRSPDLRPSGLAPALRALPSGALAALVGTVVWRFLPWPVAAVAAAGAFLGAVVITRAAGASGLRGLARDPEQARGPRLGAAGDG
ncbi:MAG: flippase [Actinomycetota bacterium]|nr:flippase [Actinomycetota bacterium]